MSEAVRRVHKADIMAALCGIVLASEGRGYTGARLRVR